MNGTIFNSNQLQVVAVDSVTGLPVPLTSVGGVLQTSAGNISLGNVSLNSSLAPNAAQEGSGNLSVVANNTLNAVNNLTQIVSNLTALVALTGNGSQITKVSNQLLNTTVSPQLVVSGTTSAVSSAVSAYAKFVVVNPTVDSWVAIGSSPTAQVNTSGSIFMAAGSQSYPFTAIPATTKVAAIANNASNTGFITITEGQ